MACAAPTVVGIHVNVWTSKSEVTLVDSESLGIIGTASIGSPIGEPAKGLFASPSGSKR